MNLLLIQLLDYRFPFGGAHKANRLLMEALAARGHVCQVVAPGYETALPRPDERARLKESLAAAALPILGESADFVVYRQKGVVVHAIVSPFSLADYGRFHGYIEERISALTPDWVLVSEDHTGLFLGAALELAPKRVVYIAHAQPTLPFGPEAFDRDPAKARLLSRVRGILTVSRYVQGYIRQHGGLESTVVGFPVYGEPPYPRFGDFSRGAVTLVNASGLKGLPIFLDLAAAFPAVPFAAVASWGTGAAERAALSALPNVTVVEPREDIDGVLAGARVLLAPSLWGEAFGVVAVEAMLRGIPVLASDLGGLPEAKLGVEYVLPVTPITEYRRTDPREKPVPILPLQHTAPWRAALGRVLAECAHYEDLADRSRQAALAFVGGLGAERFEDYLAGLALLGANFVVGEGLAPSRVGATFGTEAQSSVVLEASAHPGGGKPLPYVNRNEFKLAPMGLVSADADAGAAPARSPRRRHVLLTTHGTHGDVLPFLTLGEQLVRRGHRVTLVTHSVFADLARAAGLSFVGLGTEESYRQLIEDTARLFNQPEDVFGASAAYLERQRIFEDDRREFQAIAAAATEDTVLVARYEDIATLMVAEKRRLPMAWVLLSPSHLATARVRAELFGDALAGQLQELRAAVGLGPAGNYLEWLGTADRTLALWPSWFSDPSSGTSAVEAVGFPLNDRIETEPLPPEVEALLKDRPPLLVSSGTTKIIRPEFFAATLEAGHRMGLPVVAVTRHRELLPARLPAGCHWFPYLPFSRLLGRVRALVHHGGIGTIAHALAAGVPQLILPSGLDRPDNARRLERQGVAASLKPADWTPERVGEALAQILTPAFSETCRQLSRETREAGALAVACERIAALGGTAPSTVPTPASVSLPAAPPAIPATPAIPPTPPIATRQAVAGLSREDRARLALRLVQKKNGGERAASRIPRLPRTGAETSFPLSFAQERFWFLDQLSDDAYTVAVASYRLEGPFRREFLTRALDDLARRHEVFRTSFPEVDGVPRQRVRAEGRIPLEVRDLRSVAPADRHATVEARIRDEYRRGFDLENGPLARVLLLELADDLRILSFTLHHLVYDGWSVKVFLEELTAFYRSHLSGRPAGTAGTAAGLPELPIQYGDYAAWQRRTVAGERLETLLAYWRRELAGPAPVLDLPIDRARPALQSFRGGQRSFALGSDLAAGLRRVARDRDVSLSMVLLAGFAILLYRYTGEGDLVVGVPTAGRDQTETEGLIGVFINLLALRLKVDGRGDLRALLPGVRRAVLEGSEHQALPFEKLVADLAPERDLSRHPLFQVLFAFNQRTKESCRFEDAETTWYETGVRHARVDLALETSEEPDAGVTATFEWSTDLFEPATIERMARQLAILLAGLAEHPEGEIARLPLLTPEEQAMLLPGSIAPSWQLEDSGVETLFARQVALQPEAWAIVTPTARIAYGDLDRLADRVAARLTGGQRAVALLLPNGIHHVAALIGAQKAGRAFVCLDPEYPEARLRQIVADLSPDLLLADAATAATHGELLRSLAASGALAVDSMEAVAASERTVPKTAGIAASAGDPAYVAYTSGSTGRPKGIVQTRGGFRHLVSWFAAHFNLSPGTRVAQWIAVGHDPCYVEVWSALLAGATLAIPAPEMRQDPERVHRFLVGEEIGIVQMTPSLCRQILELETTGPAPTGLPALAAVLLTGEALPVALAREWLARFGPRPALHNVYGPTESILVTSHRVDAVPEAAVAIPVGPPVAGSRIFVLDGDGAACPIGVPGELYVRSPFLALGYHGMPEATAAAFVQNPLGTSYPDRVYRTGDVGRFRADGTLELRGRVDRQVKLRGQRLELAEVEAVLGRHAEIQECAVSLLTEDGDPRLVGFVTARGDRGDLAVPALREWLGALLPPFMVPNALVFTPALPRTATGKVDYAALPALYTAWAAEPALAGSAESDPIEPCTSEERVVAALFAELLGREHCSRGDDFFAIGGHSLLAARVANRLRAQYLIDVHVKDVITHRTVSALAGFVAHERRDQEQVGFVAQLDELLATVHSVSDEDAVRLLSGLGPDNEGEGR